MDTVQGQAPLLGQMEAKAGDDAGPVRLIFAVEVLRKASIETLGEGPG